MLVMPDSSIAHTQERVEQILTYIKALQIRFDEQVLDKMTLSAGITQTREHGTTIHELLRRADEAMYAAKQAGGDRILIYQTEPPA